MEIFKYMSNSLSYEYRNSLIVLNYGLSTVDENIICESLLKQRNNVEAMNYFPA